MPFLLTDEKSLVNKDVEQSSELGINRGRLNAHVLFILTFLGFPMSKEKRPLLVKVEYSLVFRNKTLPLE
ncbi:hypothetical protein DPMN_056985 [Dreissena polymorpha]|uniref:Uncharacterized protein n=1 Tax=Dreissena polymorpha TaxID=45954 RepID=A0A9D4CTK8_DREPO|nr:hypothetical protein DPMN_056985 [Dreissena polymorpha]